MHELNTRANQTVTVSIGNPSSMDSRDDGYVTLTVEDKASGEVLVNVEIPSGRWWRLCQGTRQEWPAFVSNHLDRLGKKLNVKVVSLGTHSAEIPDDPDDLARDVYRAVVDQLSEEWHNYDPTAVSVRRTNHGPEAIIRRWIEEQTDGN